MNTRHIICLIVGAVMLCVSCGPSYIVIPFEKRPWEYERVKKLCARVVEVTDRDHKDRYTVHVVASSRIKRVLQSDGRTFTFTPNSLQLLKDEGIMLLIARSIIERQQNGVSVIDLDVATVAVCRTHWAIHPVVYAGLLHKTKSLERSDAAKWVDEWPTNQRIDTIMITFVKENAPQGE